MNKGVLLSVGAGVLLVLAGVAAAASDDEKKTPLPQPIGPTPTKERTPAEMAEEIRNHELYWGWQEAHQFCLHPPAPPNTNVDPGKYATQEAYNAALQNAAFQQNQYQKLVNDACSTADDHWTKMTTDLDIPEDDWDVVIDALGF